MVPPTSRMSIMSSSPVLTPDVQIEAQPWLDASLAGHASSPSPPSNLSRILERFPLATCRADSSRILELWPVCSPRADSDRILSLFPVYAERYLKNSSAMVRCSRPPPRGVSRCLGCCALPLPIVPRSGLRKPTLQGGLRIRSSAWAPDRTRGLRWHDLPCRRSIPLGTPRSLVLEAATELVHRPHQDFQP
jgi:hypothetical protein